MTETAQTTLFAEPAVTRVGKMRGAYRTNDRGGVYAPDDRLGSTPLGIYIGRPRGSVDPRRVPVGELGCFGNPWRIRGTWNRPASAVEARSERALTLYREYLRERLRTDAAFAGAVRGLRWQTLLCWCVDTATADTDPVRCHGVLLARAAEGREI